MKHRPKYLKLPALVALCLMLASCGAFKRTPSARGERDGKPKFEHEMLGNKKSGWEVTEESKTEGASANVALHEFIHDWEGTPHVMGGNTKKGVDCSGFVIQAYLQVYGSPFLGRRAEDLFGETKPVKRKNLQEGDLVFFKINGRRIDHVGIYLSNDDFVHVSSSRGVMVSNLNEAYFAKRFFMGGRKEDLGG